MRKSALSVAVFLAASAIGPLYAAEPVAIPLWPNGAPGSPHHAGPEHVRLTEQGEHIVSNVHAPSITPYIPDAAASTGMGIVVIPGGGHRELWMDHEGYRIGAWLRDHGIAAFALKYRLAKEDGSTYTVEGTELSDVQRAIRIVKSRAADWHVDANRVGVIGFSAGGELALLSGTRFDAGNLHARDAADRMSSRPAFMALIYPRLSQNIAIPSDAPPAFLLCGEEDSAIADGLPPLYLAIHHAGVPAELHVLAGAGHGFGLRSDNPPSIAQWIVLFRTWLDTEGFNHD